MVHLLPTLMLDQKRFFLVERNERSVPYTLDQEKPFLAQY